MRTLDFVLSFAANLNFPAVKDNLLNDFKSSNMMFIRHKITKKLKVNYHQRQRQTKKIYR